MRILLILCWLLIPVGALAYHLGPGQRQIQNDKAAEVIAKANAAMQASQFSNADELYGTAIELLPDDDVATIRRVRLSQAQCKMECSGLNQASDDLAVLLDEMTDDTDADPDVVDQTRAALAGTHYYRTWLMRLEGKSRAQWEPEIEAARQHFTLLSEQSDDGPANDDADRYKEDLESAVRLARMDLDQLQGLPLPNQ